MNFPSDTQHLTIVGANGSGKTNAGLWHLSRRNYDLKPWIIFDFKNDDLINSIQGTFEIDVNSPAPSRPGIYVVHPHPAQSDDVENLMWRIWEHENIGVFVDEGLMIGTGNRGFRALLTQGRSKHIPMIVLSQRPKWMDRFVFSESTYFQIFRLQHIQDVKAVQEFIPFSIEKRLPEYYSYYYEVLKNEMVVLSPTPDPEAIIDTFDMRLSKIKQVV